MNLPLRLPLLLEDFVELSESSKIPADMILRGLRAQITVVSAKGGDSTQAPGVPQPALDYYASYYLYYLYENLKISLHKKAFEEARILFEETESFIRRFPHLVKKSDARYEFYRALFERETGSSGQAEAKLRKIVSENPKNPYYAMELASLMEEQDDLESAAEVYTKILEEDPAFIPALFSLGEIYLKTSEYGHAERMYLACIRLGAEFAPPYARLGVIYNDRQQYSEAADLLTQGIARSPDHTEMHYNLSYALQRLSKPFQALSHLKAAQAQKPDSIPVLNELGVLYRKLGFFKESLESLSEARSIDEENPGILWNLLWTTLLVSFEEFASQLNRYNALLTKRHFDVDRFSPFQTVPSSHPFDLSEFLSEISRAYEEIPDPLRERLRDLLSNQVQTVEMDSSEDPVFLDWIVDLFENYDTQPVELYRGILLVNVALTRSTRWTAFCFSLFELVVYRLAIPFDLDKTVEALVISAQEYDWVFANRISGLDRDSLTDWSALTEEAPPVTSLSEFLRWILNVLWIDPNEEELEEAILQRPSLEDAVRRLIRYIFSKTHEPSPG